jgi:hypothetical protein
MSAVVSDRKKVEANEARGSILRIFQECLVVVVVAMTRNGLVSDNGQARSLGKGHVVIGTID